MVLRGLHGTADEPIVLEGVLDGAPEQIDPRDAPNFPQVIHSEPDFDEDRRKFRTWFGGDVKEDQFRLAANATAHHREAGGHYPTIAEVADQAMLTLIDCQHVVIRNIGFANCWPTAIYIDNCQFITLDQLRFEGGTYCIGANGRNTHDLVVQNCRYSGNSKLWDTIDWKQVHGALDTQHPVNLRQDHRHLDGDFFRAWNVFGNVTIRNNWIGNCFNAIHFFSHNDGRRRDLSKAEFDPHNDAYDEQGMTNPLDLISNINVLVENNRFYRIRDNCVEPETFAYNWVVRYNRFDVCYRPFSLGLRQGGWFYVYGNAGVLTSKPGGEKHNTPSLMKLPKKMNAGGPFVFAHNSWLLRKKSFGKRMLRGLRHYNNAIEFLYSNSGSSDANPKAGGLFGGGPWNKTPTAENPYPNRNRNFARNWDLLDIRSDGDLSNDAFVFGAGRVGAHYSDVGYDIGSSMKYAPNVLNSTGKNLLKMHKDAIALQSPVSFTVSMPRRKFEKNPSEVQIKAGDQCGAFMKDGSLFDPFASLPAQFGKDFPFLPKVAHEKTCAGGIQSA